MFKAYGCHFSLQTMKKNKKILKNQIDDINTDKYIPLKPLRNARKCEKVFKTARSMFRILNNLTALTVWPKMSHIKKMKTPTDVELFDVDVGKDFSLIYQ